MVPKLDAIKHAALFQKFLSTYLECILTNYIDVHNIKDINKL